MRLDPPEAVSEEKITIDVRELEPLLQATPMDVPAWPESTMLLRDGRTLYLRAMTPDDAPAFLGYMEKVMHVEKDFYDIVGVRVYGEILGWIRKRVKDPFQIVGLIDGELVGFANGRILNEEIAISLHTMAYSRRGRIGWAMYYAKTYYALEILKCKEWWSTFESYNGWRLAGLEMAQPTKPWPEFQHELGGARIYYLTKKMWDSGIKSYAQTMFNSDLNFDVTDEIRERNKVFIVPAEANL